ncbi:MAG: Mov34/MPN/PAD-1 family protein [Reyranella sp.]|nr:Mov34/MPN/PAD-1 family protein [Reyranella sp.]
MKLLLPQSILQRLRLDLKDARRREIGGLLLGEHVEGETFRVVEATVQTSGGSAVHFVRDPAQHQRQLDDFFARTGNDYARFNYMGEWHSHPSFEPLPSREDMATMQSIVEDPNVGVNFLVLVIPRLTRWNMLKLSAMLFRPYTTPDFVDVEVENAPVTKSGNFIVRLARRFINR